MAKNPVPCQNEFSSSVISLMMLGSFVLLAIYSLFAGQMHNAACLPAAGIIFALPLYWKVRFDSDSATLFCCFFPKKVKYFEVKDIRYFFSKPDMPEAPAHIYFEMKDGKQIKWELTLFTTVTRQKIKEALEMRLNRSKTAEENIQLPSPEKETVQELVRKIGRTSKADKVIPAIAFVILSLFSAAEIHKHILWAKRLNSWEQVDGVILKNERKTIKSGRNRKTFSDLQYRYQYNGRIYTGKQIIYGSDDYPSWIKPGARRKILVNPANPEEAAAMVTYRGLPGKFFKYFYLIFFGAAALVTGIIAFAQFTRRPFEVPEKFLAYYSKNPPPEQRPKVKSVPNGFNPMAFSGRHKIYNDRYIVLLGDSSKTVKILMILPLLLVLPGAILGLHAVWILAAFWLFCAVITWIPVRLAFDLQDKKLYRCHFFNPDKLSRAKNISFADWKYLEISRYSAGKQGVRLKVTAFTETGKQTVFCHTALKNLPLLLDLLPVLAEKTGNLPIILNAEKN